MNSKSKALQTAKAPKPFKIVKDMVVKGGGGIVKDIGRGVKKGASSVGKALHKHFVQPEQNRKKIYNERMQEMDRKARSGEFNY